MWYVQLRNSRSISIVLSQKPRLGGDYLVIKVLIKSVHAQTRG